MEPDYYNILGVREDAGADQIKKAYRKLSKQYHPDVNPSSREAAARFQDVSEAYAVLSDGEKRSAYDKQRRTAKQKGKAHSDSRSAGMMFEAEFGRHSMSGAFDHFFGFHPDLGKEKKKTADKNEKTKTNPLDTTDLFERYMGMNGKNK